MNSAEAREGLRKAAETVNRVKERRVSVFAKGLTVQLHLVKRVDSGAQAVVIINLEGNGMTQKFNSVFLERILFEESVHCHSR